MLDPSPESAQLTKKRYGAESKTIDEFFVMQ
jgi:hypothetical protein